MATLKELTALQDLDGLFKESADRPVFIFKHSEVCPISASAFRQYEAFVGEQNDDDYLYALVLIREHRDISDAIAERTGVRHESPQAILLVNGEAIWNDSHYELTEEKFKQVVMMYEDKAFADQI